MMRLALALLCVVGGMRAALKPIDADLQPIENKADRRPAIGACGRASC